MAFDGVLAAYAFDGVGGLTERTYAPETQAGAAPAFEWTHYSATHPATERRLQVSGVPSDVIEALLEKNPTPRCEVREDGVLLVLRSVTLLTTTLPEELHTIRIWTDPKRVITAQRHPVAAVADVEDLIRRGVVPETPGGLLTELAERLIDRLDILIEAMIRDVDELEDAALGPEWSRMSGSVAKLRLRALALRRAVGPQREALSTLVIERPGWLLGEKERRDLRDTGTQVARMLDDLNGIRERAALIDDQLEVRRSADTNRNMLLLTMVTVGLAPLNLLSSMFGMNVGGIPGADLPGAFGWMAIAFALIGSATVFALSRIHRN